MQFENFRNITRAHKSGNALAFVRFPLHISPGLIHFCDGFWLGLSTVGLYPGRLKTRILLLFAHRWAYKWRAYNQDFTAFDRNLFNVSFENVRVHGKVNV